MREMIWSFTLSARKGHSFSAKFAAVVAVEKLQECWGKML
jgi:hypothetical protein